jgi:hypothetical protein
VKTHIVSNPWLDMSEEWPWVARVDESCIGLLRDKFHVNEIPPMPWAGNPRKAAVILLDTNAQWHGESAKAVDGTEWNETAENVKRAPTFLSAARFQDDTFFPLDFPHSAWNKYLGRLIRDCSRDIVYNHLAVVQFFPYRSENSDDIPYHPDGRYDDNPTPSQDYTFKMMNEILESRGDDVVFVAQRCFEGWMNAIWHASGQTRWLPDDPRVVWNRLDCRRFRWVTPNMYANGDDDYQLIVQSLRQAQARHAV